MNIIFGSSKALFGTDYRDNSEGGASILEKHPQSNSSKLRRNTQENCQLNTSSSLNPTPPCFSNCQSLRYQATANRGKGSSLYIPYIVFCFMERLKGLCICQQQYITINHISQVTSKYHKCQQETFWGRSAWSVRGVQKLLAIILFFNLEK